MCPLFSQEPVKEWTFHKSADGKTPNGPEQQALWLTNRARQNPTAEGIWLASSPNADITIGINFFSVDTRKLKSEFAALPAHPPAAFDIRIHNGCAAHNVDLIARDTQDHRGQVMRVDDAGFVSHEANYSSFSYAMSALNLHAAFNIDWANTPDGMQANRPHRRNVMSDYPNIGIAIDPVANPKKTIGPEVASVYYAVASKTPDQFNRFLVGTVWTDKNKNEIYDPGEGAPGITVMPNRGEYYAVTGVAGGYAIPATESGSYLLTFSGGALKGEVRRLVEVGDFSVLVPWLNGLEPTPALPDLRLRHTGRQVIVDWENPFDFDLSLESSVDAKTWKHEVLPNDSTRIVMDKGSAPELRLFRLRRN